jgi:mRNA interferase RelE/StbE
VAKYDVQMRRSAEKELLDLPDKNAAKIVRKIRLLAEIPRPPAALKLAGFEDRFRLRQGDYRIIYSVDDKNLTVLIVKIGHRREVYR